MPTKDNMRVKVCPMDELPCYVECDKSLLENDDEWILKNGVEELVIPSEFAEDTSYWEIQKNMTRMVLTR